MMQRIPANLLVEVVVVVLLVDAAVVLRRSLPWIELPPGLAPSNDDRADRDRLQAPSLLFLLE